MERFYNGVLDRSPTSKELQAGSDLNASDDAGIKALADLVLSKESSKHCESIMEEHKDSIMTGVQATFGRVVSRKSLSNKPYWENLLRLFRYPTEYPRMLSVDVSMARAQLDELWRKSIYLADITPTNPDNKIKWSVVSKMISEMAGPGGVFENSAAFKSLADAVRSSLGLDKANISLIPEAKFNKISEYTSKEVDQVLNLKNYDRLVDLLSSWNNDSGRQPKIYAEISQAVDKFVGEKNGFEYFVTLQALIDKNRGKVDESIDLKMDMSYHPERILVSMTDSFRLGTPLSSSRMAATPEARSLTSTTLSFNLTETEVFPATHRFVVNGVKFFVHSEVSQADATIYRETLSAVGRIDVGNYASVANTGRSVYISQNLHNDDGGFAEVGDNAYLINMPTSNSVEQRAGAVLRENGSFSVQTPFEVLTHEFYHVVQYAMADLSSHEQYLAWEKTLEGNSIETTAMEQTNLVRKYFGIDLRAAYRAILIESELTKSELETYEGLPMIGRKGDVEKFMNSLEFESLQDLMEFNDNGSYTPYTGMTSLSFRDQLNNDWGISILEDGSGSRINAFSNLNYSNSGADNFLSSSRSVNGDFTVNVGTVGTDALILGDSFSSSFDDWANSTFSSFQSPNYSNFSSTQLNIPTYRAPCPRSAGSSSGGGPPGYYNGGGC